MKNAFLLLLLVTTFACSKTEIETQTFDHNNATTIVDDESDIFTEYQSTAITAATFQEFESSLVYNENGEIIGGRFDQIRAELSEDEAAKFWESIFRKPVVFLDETREDIDYNLIFTQACPVVLLENNFSLSDGTSIQTSGVRCKTASGFFCRMRDCPQ